MSGIYMKSATAWVFAAAGAVSVTSAFFNDFDTEPHHYYEKEPADPFAQVLERTGGNVGSASGKTFIARLLQELEISADSQVLVFTKTSLQRKAVSPENPRAIYFNEDTYLGWMPGGRVEIASYDPELGFRFYFEDEREEREPATFQRPRVCLECHAGSATNFLPGPLARSVYPDTRGRSRGAVTEFELVSHQIPLAQRWGGWFVTGASDSLPHIGNRTGKRTSKEGGSASFAFDPPSSPNLDPSLYPRTTSNALPLLVFDHQIGMHYRIIEAHYKVRQAAYDAVGAGDGWKQTLPDGALETAKEEARKVAADLLFANESYFPPGSVDPDPAFAEAFRKNRNPHPDGRSLKDFALEEGRIFKHRLSYMIHSNAFQGLPESFQKLVFSEIEAALEPGSVQDGETGEAAAGIASHIPTKERKEILSIARATVPGFPG